MWTQIAAHIGQVTLQTFEISQRRSVSGGCINQGYVVSGNTGTYFVKLNKADKMQMFEAEALGLKQMRETDTICVPKPICVGTAFEYAYIVLEWLDLGGKNNSQVWETMGCQLAAMHRWHPFQLSTSPKPPEEKEARKGFGWDLNNTIGSTPQINTWTSDWVEFFTQHRLGDQFQLARRRGGQFPLQEKLLAAVPEILNHQPQPSLVHGDLWGGNAGVTTSGEPVIFDPAAYIGDREVDIAMTELFGGFPTAFYRGYNDVWALVDGYKRRKTLYNLYHILNHFNLFGGGYGSQANQMIEEILG